MKRLLQISAHALNLARLYPTSFYGGFKNRKLFEDTETNCMFIGYPRSGHTLIGALLDAHPNMIIAHELDALKFIYARFSKRQIYYLLLKNSRAFAERGCKTSRYSYGVPNQLQGRFEKLQIIGDKQGEASTLRFQSIPGLLQQLRNTIDESSAKRLILQPRIAIYGIQRNASKMSLPGLSRQHQTFLFLNIAIKRYYAIIP